MKKFFINLNLVIIGFVIYYLQSNFFSWFTIAGVKPNLFVIYILFIGLFGTTSMTIIYSAVCGIFLDLLYETHVGVSILGLILVGLIAILFNKNFSKDSRITAIFMTAGATIVFEVVTVIMKYFIYSANIGMLSFIKILAIEVIYNIIITIIIYPLIQKYGYHIENTYKGNQILTRYF